MSFGWQSESALLPSKSKIINNVSKNTILDLKAVVLAHEKNKNSKNIIRKKPTKSEDFTKKNLNEKSKDKKMIDQNEDTVKESKVYDSLLLNTELYNKMMEQKNSTLLRDQTNASLVDFDRKICSDRSNINNISSVLNNENNNSTKEINSINDEKKTILISNGSKIKTQWEKTLGSSSRRFVVRPIHCIHSRSESGKVVIITAMPPFSLT
jgi:hypothetical protein